MIKTISADQLIPGMYIHELNCPWVEHPFVRNQFKITETKDIKKIHEMGIKSLKIDTCKGLNVQENLSPLISSMKKRDTSQSSEQQPLKKQLPQTRKKAKNIKTHAENAIANIMADIKLGQQVELEQVTPIIDKMSESVLENHNALLGLSRIRNMDTYTFEHSVNIGVLMMAFSKSRNMPGAIIHEVGIGGLLHDIGKALTPPEILNKPAKLTDEELVIMRHHVVDSHLILSKTPGISQNALDVAALHHEKYDGSGYPDGKTGDEISLIGQMSAIVDVYDALTADRCYHKGQDPSVVLKRMLSWTGSHFNPTLMQEFVHCVGIYPPATLVMLSNHHLAVVTENNSNLLAPCVITFLNTKSHETIEPLLIDLSKQEKLKVISSEADVKWNIDPQKYLDII
ncbi:MAG: HD-GYP domain-containing protein [gamma proteobacterium symbiont of Bathyaustriella thionipta]|nr:HD-GYP domain-containing protein [gamma proteobacterium symbiont of Bathyaustriella thionipta]MCU7950846.1 HD-GYP domain-containing protein [gamma proteobacterium symbiont of Bathyaustriella thionipta]MCU7953429.1 HD-GYP domain-containing protein [gamma proteobacterium symbiont of Bathyaustriella thionipta]MCU7958297.1 HD-GYP domain-containing protein [gamma proteobacterium symbiont of Bathyaustriella thionipta]MCU7967760.1 HD-GYP domain-containing protein [gamma proteobacterium symbiont of 